MKVRIDWLHIVLVAVLLGVVMLGWFNVSDWKERVEEVSARSEQLVKQNGELLVKLGEHESIIGTLEETNARLTSENETLKAEVETLKAPKKTVSASGSVKAPTVAKHTGAVADLIRSICTERGLSAAQGDIMVEIARRESTIGTNPRAYEVGRECVGLFQLDSNKGTYEQRCDNVWSTHKAIDYVIARYGSPEGALAHSNQKGWY